MFVVCVEVVIEGDNMGTQGTCMIAFRLPFCLGGLFLAFLLLFSEQSWGACTQNTGRCSYTGYGCSSQYAEIHQVGNLLCLGDRRNSSSCYSSCVSLSSTIMPDMGGIYCSSDRWYVPYTECSTQAEVDSIQCINDGGTWNGSTCSHVVNDTASMHNLVNHCQNDLEGTPNFRFNDDGNVVGYCDMCDRSGDPDDMYGGYTNPYMQGAIEAKREQCCNGNGTIGEFSCQASAGGCYGAKCDWSGTNGGASVFSGNCDLSKPVAMGMTCEEYGMGEDKSEEGAGGSSSDTTGTGSSSGTAPGDSAGMDFEYDYNDSLHKIIDSLGKLISISQLMLEKIGIGGDTIIVNTERDSVINNINVEVQAPNVYFNDSVYKTQLGNLENIQGRIKQLLGPADTNIQVSLYDTIANSFNKIQRTLDTGILYGFRLDSVLFTPDLVDTAHYGYMDTIEKYMGTGRGYGEYTDSIAHDWGADTISAGFDSSYAYGECPSGDSACINGYGDSLGIGFWLGGDTGGVVGELGGRLQDNVDSAEDSLPSIWSNLWDSTKQYAPYRDFEQRFMEAVGATIPNTNTCPEHCSSFNVEIQNVAWIKSAIGIDFGLCRPISSFGGANTLLFIRLLLRILTIISCMYITLWEVSTKRGKIGL